MSVCNGNEIEDGQMEKKNPNLLLPSFTISLSFSRERSLIKS